MIERPSYLDLREANKSAFITANSIWEKLFPGWEFSEQQLENINPAADYLVANFKDSKGRFVEARYQPYGEKGFQLFANMGDPLALIELKILLENEGVKNIVALRAHSTMTLIPEVQKELDNYSK